MWAVSSAWDRMDTGFSQLDYGPIFFLGFPSWGWFYREANRKTTNFEGPILRTANMALFKGKDTLAKISERIHSLPIEWIGLKKSEPFITTKMVFPKA